MDFRTRDTVWYTNTFKKKPRQEACSQADSIRGGNFTAVARERTGKGDTASAFKLRTTP
jgi:hypothetical protein